MRRALSLGLVALVAAACAGPPSPTPAGDTACPTTDPGGATSDLDPILALELVDVRTCETFTLAELAEDGPVLVETMAIWCSSCRAQQREVVAAHGLTEFHSVGIDVDPNERAPDLAAYSEREGFDWRFVIATPRLVDLLSDRFGFAVSNPPSTPTFVVSDGSIRALEFNRFRSAQELVDELGPG